MTEAQLRKKYIDCAKDYYGAVMGDRRHREIVDAYNSFTPHPRGHKLTYTDEWCAAFDSAIAVLCCMTDIIPVECSCGEQIKAWKNMGRWIEDDKHRPEIGELMYYDWQDEQDYARTDNAGAPDHVGIVVWVSGGNILVIEGNKGNSSVVGYREMNVNGRYIRGYGCPDYASKATPETCSATLPVLRRGSTGEPVKSLQTLLNLWCRYSLDIDGSFGPATDAALRDFQSRHELAADGDAGPATWAALIAP
jgi:hypothetical protein